MDKSVDRLLRLETAKDDQFIKLSEFQLNIGEQKTALERI